MRTFYLSFVMVFWFFSALGQDWTGRIIYSTSYMGPNALPVPEIKWGSYESNLTMELAYERHFNDIDNTKNLFFRLFYPIVKDKVGTEFYMVPFEWYRYTEEAIEERNLFDTRLSYQHAGDAYLSTYWQVWKDISYVPDLLLSINLKTASGELLEAARFTDSPGYFFDASLGKDLYVSESFRFRLYGLIGFYSYQTFTYNYFQNDALLYGVGFQLHKPVFFIQTSWSGYNGYIGYCDKPMVLRCNFQTNIKSPHNFKIRFQYGLRDFPYTSLRFSWLIQFNGQ